MPGLRPLIRDAASVQIGLEPPHALVLRGATAAHAYLLRALDGRHDYSSLVALAATVSVDAPELDELLALLTEHQLLVTFAPGSSEQVSDATEAARLSPDTIAIALRRVVHGAPTAGSTIGPQENLYSASGERPSPVKRETRSGGGGGDAWSDARAVLSRRGSAWVEVHGAGRVGSGVAALLAAAGIGRVSVVDAARCGLGDVGPLGLPRDAVGSSRQLAVRQRVTAVSAARSTPHPSSGRAPDLYVLTPDAGPSASLATAWSRRDEPQLLAYVREIAGVVGPLVLPGRTACLRCLDLHRRDVDPAWPRVAAQLGDGMARSACDVSLATFVAAQCALQALAFLDGDEVRALSATLETRDGSIVRRRTWRPHVDCGCHWPLLEDRDGAGGAVGRRTVPTASATMTG